MVNGRLSTRSYARQRRAPVRWLYASMLRSLRLCLMQSERDAERIISLGADPRSVHRTGNIKFDQPLPASSERKVTRAELGIAAESPLLVAGSTHAIEEEMLVDAYRAVLARQPSAQLLLAPRHIERADAVEAMVRSRGLTVRRRSRGAQPEGGTSRTQVVILDSRGELASVYQEATVAFVGGTLVPIGGHNLLEPAFWAKPVLFGPHTDHCVEIANLLVHADGGRRVTTVEELTTQLARLFDDHDERIRMGHAAHSMVQQNQGALQATIDAIDRQLTSVGLSRPPSWSPGSFPLMAGR
jgi:3-deoxy-D-manno-octulosonic-acid transferase